MSYLTHPRKSSTMPFGIPYIIGNELAERFSFYGMKCILIIFMTQYLTHRPISIPSASIAQTAVWNEL